jgi:CBS domain-containing protein
MHRGLVSVPADASLGTVARMMSTYRLHAILVSAHGEGERAGVEPWGVVTDADVVRAADTGDLDGLDARSAVAAPALTVSPADDLADAARLLAERAVSHAIVVEPETRRPVGVLSTLDVVRALAGFPERHPTGS